MSVIMDFPTAWTFVRETKPEDHHERCSWRTENGALLCDCNILNDEYERRRAIVEQEYIDESIVGSPIGPYHTLTSNLNLRAAIRAALNELGVPGPGYPAPVANAVDILETALNKGI